MKEETIVSVRLDKELHSQMKLHEEINWSAILRKAINREIEQLERIDLEKARRAAKMIDVIRKSRAFDSGKSSVDIIRKWRDKRK